MSAGKLSIRRSVERLLIPALATRGFERIPGSPNEVLNPYGRFRRRAADGAFQTIEILFNKNRSSHFRLYFATTRREEEGARQVTPNYHLVPRRWTTYAWFGVRKTARQGITESEYDVAVNYAVRLLSDVERVFSGGRLGYHVVKMPESAGAYFAHLGLVLIVFSAPILALVWLLGWLFRNL